MSDRADIPAYGTAGLREIAAVFTPATSERRVAHVRRDSCGATHRLFRRRPGRA